MRIAHVTTDDWQSMSVCMQEMLQPEDEWRCRDMRDVKNPTCQSWENLWTEEDEEPGAPATPPQNRALKAKGGGTKKATAPKRGPRKGPVTPVVHIPCAFADRCTVAEPGFIPRMVRADPFDDVCCHMAHYHSL